MMEDMGETEKVKMAEAKARYAESLQSFQQKLKDADHGKKDEEANITGATTNATDDEGATQAATSGPSQSAAMLLKSFNPTTDGTRATKPKANKEQVEEQRRKVEILTYTFLAVNEEVVNHMEEIKTELSRLFSVMDKDELEVQGKIMKTWASNLAEITLVTEMWVRLAAGEV